MDMERKSKKNSSRASPTKRNHHRLLGLGAVMLRSNVEKKMSKSLRGTL